MYTIIGLGNPGEEYVNTRHNTGQIIQKLLEDSLDLGKKLRFVDSSEFMNNSGKAISKLITSKKPARLNSRSGGAAENLVVIHDDLDLPLGTYKLSFNKGPGGHRGVLSIIKAVKTQEFLRLRIGISSSTPSGKLKKPTGEEKVLKFILAKFKPEELTVLKKLTKKIAVRIETLVERGREVAMSQIVS
jgi:peptidyl-tRNA hydrolase, PTH1 family